MLKEESAEKYQELITDPLLIARSGDAAVSALLLKKGNENCQERKHLRLLLLWWLAWLLGKNAAMCHLKWFTGESNAYIDHCSSHLYIDNENCLS